MKYIIPTLETERLILKKVHLKTIKKYMNTILLD